MANALLAMNWGFNDTDGNPCGDQPGGAPPGSPPTFKYDGPWFSTQIMISSVLGVSSFIIFSYARTRWPLLFAPRTKLKGFSPHEAHAQQAFFGWILPTIRTSEFTILQIVGLDAAVLLGFFRMAFMLFSTCSLFAITILMPINYKVNGHTGDSEDDDDNDWPCFAPNEKPSDPPPGWLDLISDANSYLFVHLLFTYLFTLLVLRFTYKNYVRFVRSRQLFSLELVHSIAGRTVLVDELPSHLRGERALAEYFEALGLAVESVSVVREVGPLKTLIDERTRALLALEAAWVDYVGNPSTVEDAQPLDGDGDGASSGFAHSGTLEAARPRVVVPHRTRPTMRPRWFGPTVDALDYLDERFRAADELVRRKRRTGRFRATHVAFVTFEKMSDAQIAVQTAHSPSPVSARTHLAPEPRDIVWTNMTHSPSSVRTRELLVLGCICALFFSWIFPITALASLLSYKEIQKVWPALARLIAANAKVQAIVQNSLPSVAMVSLNATLPFLLEALTYVQGFRARSLVEYSLMKKYFLFLLVNVVFIFLLASTYLQLIRDLANSPAKIPERIATALQKGNAKHFFLSYVILQGLGIMPLQLLNLGVVIPQLIYRMFITRTPRDYAELNAPPMINYGVVYPQAILVFVITLLYSVVQPLILIFGAIYFGVAYVVYKYKLLFVFYKPYESQGQAWPITFARLIWGVVIFLTFMSGIFILRTSWWLSVLVAPLLGGVVIWAWHVDRTFRPLSKYVALSSVCEVQRGEDAADVVRLKTGHPVTWSQSNLNHRRYAQNDDTLYVAPEDERTDYSQPPMANWYSGVLNTGKRRYGHPALNGVLPLPWLPLKKGQTLVNRERVRGGKHGQDAVVLTLRKRFSAARKPSRQVGTPGGLVGTSNGATPGPSSGGEEERNPWQDSAARPRGQHPLAHRLSFDDASGVIMLPDDDWMMEEVGSDSDSDFGTPSPIPSREASTSTTEPADGVATEGAAGPVVESPVEAATTTSPASPTKHRYSTYYHHPERKRQTVPGAFPATSRS